MASSRKLQSDSLITPLLESLRQNGVNSRHQVTVALSGGVDSVVLLHLASRAAGLLGFRLSAIHVNHQLQIQADAWVCFCQQLCDDLGVPLHVSTPKIVRSGGESLEAVARSARYAAFAHHATDFLLLAHHADDQAETLLLQLLRGAGVAGLAAMPVRQTHGGQVWLRPLLTSTRQDIENYARKNKLTWVEDPSNRNCNFDRNFLRQSIMPLLLERFPAARQTIGRSARHMAEAQVLLQSYAYESGCMRDEFLALDCWAALPLEQQRNVLRCWLLRHELQLPAERRLLEMVRQLQNSRPDAQLRIAVTASCELRRYRDRAWLVPHRELPPPGWQMTWSGEAALDLTDLGGRLHFAAAEGQGIRRQLLDTGAVTVRLRAGGERMRLYAGRPGKSLQHWFQEAGVPPWLRDTTPLVYVGEQLVWVAGLGAAVEAQALPGEVGVSIDFTP